MASSSALTDEPPGSLELVHGSENFIYLPGRSMGSGATSSVYEGRNKKSGIKVAVKVLKTDKSSLNTYYQREMEILTKLDHPNIVACLHVEQGTRSQEKLVILEWCRGGSLYNMLEQPENKYGLPEDEVMSVIQHLASALEYLHQKGIVHRDVKPGNILVFIDEALRNIYKLADFGTAHRKEDGDPKTIEGTVEYLHPYAFEQALEKTHIKPYGPYLDLWSAGCTFVHAMTGRLPFKTLTGRKDRPSMLKMVKEKEKGAIRAEQIGLGDRPFRYYMELPPSCQLSPACKRSVVPLVARLLETDPADTIDVEEFFAHAQRITRKVPVIIYHMAQCCHFTIYCEPDRNIRNQLHLIETETGIAPQDQILYIKGEPLNLERTYRMSKSDAKLPRTTMDEPAILLSTLDKNKEHRCEWLEMAPTHDEKVNAALPQMPPAEGVMADYSLAKEVSGYVCLLSFRTKLVVTEQQIFVAGANALRKQTKEMLTRLRETMLTQNFTFRELEHRTVDWVKNIEEQLLQIEAVGKLLMNIELTTMQDKASGDVIYNTVQNAKERAIPGLKKIQERRDKLRQSDGEVLKKFEALEKEKLATINPGCKREDRCIEKTEDIMRLILEIFRDFKKDKGLQFLGYNETQIHRYQRNLLKDYLKKSEKQFRQCLENYQFLYSCVKHYIVKIQKIQGHAENLEREVVRVNDFMDKFRVKQKQREDLVMFWMNKMKKLIGLPTTRPDLLGSGSLSDSGFGGSGKAKLANDLQVKQPIIQKRPTSPASIVNGYDSSSSLTESDKDTGIGTEEGSETSEKEDDDDGVENDEEDVIDAVISPPEITAFDVVVLKSKLDLLTHRARKFGLMKCQAHHPHAVLDHNDCFQMMTVLNKYGNHLEQRGGWPRDVSLPGSDSSGSTVSGFPIGKPDKPDKIFNLTSNVKI